MTTLDPKDPVDAKILERQQRRAQEVEKLKQQANHQAAWDAWFERRFCEGLFKQLKEGNTLCDVIGAALAGTWQKLRKEYQPQIAALETRTKQLEQQSSLDSRFFDLERRLDARQLARDDAKRGPKGSEGRQGPRGERGPRGEKGDPGAPAKQPLICGWKIDAAKFRAVPFGPDGEPLPELNLRPLAPARR